MNNIITFRCHNTKSKFKYILNSDVISGQRTLNFVFHSNSWNCFWPIKTSLYELINDGWKIE